MRIFVPLALTAALIALAAAVSFGAGRSTTKVTLHISPGGTADYFYGLVKAEGRACRVRKLTVLRDPDGASGYSSYAKGLESNSDGTWTVDPAFAIPNGFYKVVAAKKKTASRACAKGTSKPFFVD